MKTTTSIRASEGWVGGALGRVLASVVVASSKGTWARMKICAAEDCRWAYYDHSRSRTGRHKTRRYRRKKRSSAWQGG
jgi:predicted RNA-binding Zn ribbon-like protein